MNIPIISGIYMDETAGIRSSYPLNMIPVPTSNGISEGYLRPADGLKVFGLDGPGHYRGGINWNGTAYVAMGTKLLSVADDGMKTIVGDIGHGSWVTMRYSFDRLAIASGGRLYYLKDGVLSQVTDSDIGVVIDVEWIDGYFITTDGVNLVQTELNDPTEVNPLKYGSSEADPDPVLRVIKLRNELCAVNRYTIEVFDNIGGTGFAFQRIEGAMIPVGAIGTHACVKFADSLAVVGGALNESPSVYLCAGGSYQKIATREIEILLAQYSETVLSTLLIDVQRTQAHQFLRIHLADQCLVFDAAATSVVGKPVWHILSTAIEGRSQYRALGIFYCYDKWIAGDPAAPRLCTFSQTDSSHYGQKVSWEFGTQIVYAAGNDAIVLELELVGLPGRVKFGVDPTIWTSYSTDGEKWSQERPIKAGVAGQHEKRLCWRTNGRIRHMRIQKFRGTSDAHVSVAALEAAFDPLFVRPK